MTWQCQREKKRQEALKILFLNGMSLRRTNDKQRRHSCKGRGWDTVGFRAKAESGAWWAVWHLLGSERRNVSHNLWIFVNRTSLTLKKRCFSLGTVAQLERVQVENKKMFKELTWLWIEKRIIANLWGFFSFFLVKTRRGGSGDETVDTDRCKTWGKFLPLVGTAAWPAYLFTDWNNLQKDRCYHKQERSVEYSV